MPPSRGDVYVARVGRATGEGRWPRDSVSDCVSKVVRELRAASIATDRDYLGRSLKAQLREANKHGFSFAVIIGEDELTSSEVVVRDLHLGEQCMVPLSKLVERLNKELR